ncbi:hypothetical protein R1sor_007215 [Riccia sorocarpa]|uniref:Reverse transcriptase domain-containing protein n=1 Tax=Riccia sorocarpa TaxID=122646 RepID=A0ABD3HSI9_9MARC
MLDRFYAPVSFFRGLTITIVHHADFTLSDHLPVSLLLHGVVKPMATTNTYVFFKVDSRILKDPQLKSKIGEVWRKHRVAADLSIPSNFPCVEEVRALIKEAQYQESQQVSKLYQLKSQLWVLGEKALDSATDRDNFATLTEEVCRLESIQQHKFRLWSRDKFLAFGETNSRYYLSKFKARNLQNRISSLKLDDGTVLRSQTDLVREVYRFFSSMYERPVDDASTTECRSRLLDRLKSTVTNAEPFLTESPSARKFLDVLHSAPRGKAPGIDGFTYEALLELWSETGDDFTSMISTCWLHGAFPATLLEGLIKLIPKEIYLESLHNWRPIALLNAHYKLLAKVTACRLSVLLPRIILPQQQGFIRGRSVHSCVLNLLLAQDSLKRSKKQGAFVMLDLEKAYDRLSLDFLWETLRRLNFGEAFIKILQGLSHGATARVHVNAALSPESSIGRGVRQGCPLAPLLFALSTIPFILAIQDKARTGDLKLITLPGNVALDVCALGDDTAVFLKVVQPSFQVFLDLLHSFQLGSGAKINIRKSKILLIGRYTRPPDWLLSGPFHVLGKSETARYLGVTVASVLKPQDAWIRTINALSSRLLSFSGKSISFEDRYSVLRFLLQTKLSFVLSLTTLRRSHQKTLRQLLRQFLWGFSVSEEEAALGRSWSCRAHSWLSLSSFQVPDGSRDSILLSKLLSIPSVPGVFLFQAQQWRLHPAQSKYAFPLSVSTAYATLVNTYAPDWCQILNSRWQRASKFGHPSSSCAACGLQEDILHIFISYPAALRLWSTIRNNCALVSTVLSDLLTSASIPSALLQISNLRGGPKIASLMLLVHGFRACWRRRCLILFEGVTRSYTWVSVVISVIQTLLAEAAVISDKRRALLHAALRPILSYLPEIPPRFRDSYQRIFSG